MSNEIDKTVAERLLWHREFTGLTQAEYASEVGCTRQAYSLWEAGIRRLSLDGALAIRARWGLTLDWILLGRDEALPISVRNAWLSRSRDNS